MATDDVISLFKYNHCTPFEQLMGSLKVSKFDPSIQVCSLKDMGRDLLKSWNTAKRTTQQTSQHLDEQDVSLIKETEHYVMELLDSAHILQANLSSSSPLDRVSIEHGDLGEYEHTLIFEHRNQVAALSELSSYRRKHLNLNLNSDQNKDDIIRKHSPLENTFKVGRHDKKIAQNDENINIDSIFEESAEMERLINLKKFQNRELSIHFTDEPNHDTFTGATSVVDGRRDSDSKASINQSSSASSNSSIKPQEPLKEFQVPWYLVNERCSTDPIDHKGEARRRALPPPPYLPASEVDAYHDMHGVVMVPRKSGVPRIDRKGCDELKLISDKEESRKLAQLPVKERVIAMKLKVQKQREYLEMELGYNLEAHALHGKTKKNYLSGQSSPAYLSQQNDASCGANMVHLIGQPTSYGSVAALEVNYLPIKEATAANKRRYPPSKFCLEKQFMG